MSSHAVLDGLIVAAGHVSPRDSRAVGRDVDSGRLVKLRRGVYVERSDWDARTAREQHVLRVRAVLACGERPALVAGVSAAAVWGLPVGVDWPDEVTLLDKWEGGGRSEPGVRRISTGHRSAIPAEVDGIPVVTLPRAALQAALAQHPRSAIGTLDRSLWRRADRRVIKQDLWEELDRWSPRAGLRTLRDLIGFSTHLSDSMGESECRYVIRELGFEEPELQTEFRDPEGSMETDYFWRSVRRYGEFDGKVKYTHDEYTRGDPAEVLWREKKREDRLRRQDLAGTRILTEHVRRPARLERLLVEAGIPRRRSR